MFTPTSYEAVLLAGLITLLCWGLWANTLASAMRKWRFEFYYIDFALACIVVSVVFMLTLGSFGPGITAYENFMIVRKKLIFLAAVAGAVFGISHILLGAACAVAGIGTAFLTSFGFALSARLIWFHLATGNGEPAMVGAAALLAVLAAALGVMAYRALRAEQDLNRLKKAAENPDAPLPAEPPTTALGATLAAVSGLLFSVLFPMVDNARNDIIAFEPYPLAVLFAGGAAFTIFISDFFFTNLPVRGRPVAMTRYFKGSFGQHLPGWFGGLLWTSGFAALLASQAAPAETGSTDLFRHVFVFAAPLLAVVSGLVVWKELRVSGSATRLLLTGSVLYGAAAVLAYWTLSA